MHAVNNCCTTVNHVCGFCLFFLYSYWPGCLALLRQTNQWQRALQLEVELDDIRLLNGQTKYGKYHCCDSHLVVTIIIIIIMIIMVVFLEPLSM